MIEPMALVACTNTIDPNQMEDTIHGIFARKGKHPDQGQPALHGRSGVEG
jgi:hypothetical protein